MSSRAAGGDRLRRRRRLAAVATAILLLGFAVLLTVLHHRAARELAGREAELAALITSSHAASHRAEAALASGRYDLAIALSSRMVGELLGQFEGYAQETRRGNRFRITRIRTTFHDGYAVLDAEADFDWRLGLYHGPIAVRYLAFSRGAADGDSSLYFRVASVRTLARWRLFNRWLAPILTLRMQKSLEIPDLRLPVGLGPPARLRAVRRRLAGGKVTLVVPPRSWSFGRRRAWALATPERLGLVVESASEPIGGVAVEHGDAAAPAAVPDVRVAVRGSLLAALLRQAVAPREDVQITIARLPRIWTRPSRLLGVAFDNAVDLVFLAGTLDVTRCELAVREGRMRLRAGITGECEGLIEGKVYGVGVSVPIRVRPAMEAELPLAVAEHDGAVALAIDAGGFRIPYVVEAQVLRYRLRFRRELPVGAGELMRDLTLPALVAAEVPLPRRVERGRVLETKPWPVRLGWKVEIPQDLSGMLTLTSELTAADGGLDEAVRLGEGEEDFVAVLQAERRQVEGNVVDVGEGEVDLFDLGAGLEDGFRHRVEGVLDGAAGVAGEGLEEEGAGGGEGSVIVDGVDGCSRVAPLGGDAGGEDAVFGLAEGGEVVAAEVGEGGVGGLEEDEVGQAGGGPAAGAAAPDGGGAALVAGGEGVRMGGAVDLEARPGALVDRDLDLRHLGAAPEQPLGDARAEALERAERGVGGERVDGVAHGVGREDGGVVARDVGGGEVAAHADADRQVAEHVALRAALDLDQAHALLAVGVLAEHDLGSSVRGVAPRREQQRHVVVLRGVAHAEDDRHLRMEALDAAAAKVDT